MQTTQEKPFKPTNDLILFAADFARLYQRKKPANYFSGSKNYRIEYNYNSVFGAPAVNIWRIETLTHAIQVSIEGANVIEITPDFVFFFVIWSGVFIYNKNTFKLSDFCRADKEALGYYFTTGRDVKNIVKGYTYLFSTLGDTDFNANRMVKILGIIESREQVVGSLKEFSYLVDKENKTVTLYPQHLTKKSYYKFLDGNIKPADISMSDVEGRIITRMKEIYLPKEYKIFFGFKKDLFQLAT